MPERRTEAIARRIVEAHLGVLLQCFDTNTGQSIHDYDVLYLDREPGALEVFVAVEESEIARSRAFDKHAGEGYATTMVSRSWIVSVDSTVQLKNLWEPIESFLARAEALGLDLVRAQECYRHRELLADARKLGIEYARAFDSERSEPERIIHLSISSGGMSGGPDAAAEELERLLWDTQDVRAKLKASGRTEREAFVLSHLTRYSLWGALDDGLPSRLISLPPEITAVWIARGDGQGWRFAPSTGWEELSVLPAATWDGLPDV